MELQESPGRGTMVSPRDRIVQRLFQHGIPLEYLDQLQPGLIAFVQENKSSLPMVVSAIIPTPSDISKAQRVYRSASDENSDSAIKDMFIESQMWLYWLMFEDEPQSSLKKLAEKEVGQRAVCGAVWGHQDLAYRCRTCEYDPTCAICVPCFQNGNHKDHDYSIIYTGGGCCDCGDITAWKREGFCSKHVGTGQLQPLSSQIADCVGPVLDALFLCWKDTLSAIEDDVVKEDGQGGLQIRVANELSTIVVDTLLDFSECSEGLLCLVSKKISQPAGLLYCLLRGEKFLSVTVVKRLHDLLLKLLGEPLFKYEFASAFTKYYPEIIQEAVKECSDSIIEKYPLIPTFSVQIFTVPTVTPRLVREFDLVGVLLGCLGDLLCSCLGGDGCLNVDRWCNLQHTTVRLVEDTRLVLSHDEVLKYVVHDQPDILRIWLRLLGLVQGMDPQKRARDVHTWEENGSLLALLILEHCIEKVQNLLVGVLSSDDVEELKHNSLSCLYVETHDHDDGPRDAKVGKILEEGSVCFSSTRKNSVNEVLESTDTRYLTHPNLSKVAWLVSECLNVIEIWLENILPKTSLTTFGGSGMGYNMLNLRKELFPFGGHRDSASKWRKSMTSPPIWETKFSESSQQTHTLRSTCDDPMDLDVKPLGILSLTSWPEVVHDVASQEISFHIPLHRFLALLLRKAMKLCCESNVSESMKRVPDFTFSKLDFFSEVLGKYHSSGFSAFLMEHPLRLRVFSTQVRAGMWRRNGDTTLYMLDWYYGVHRFETAVEVDLFLLQCCAALAPPELFVTRIIERFALSHYLDPDHAECNEYEADLVQEMLTLIIHIVKERRCCGLSQTENLRRELVHKLAVEDVTHSQLVKALPRDLSKSDKLQEVVDAVAVYTHPSSTKQGSYTLKKSCWNELDLYHPRWSSRDLQAAQERYTQSCKISPLNVQLPKWTRIFGPLNTISRVATSRPVFLLVRAVLFYAVSSDTSSVSRAPDKVLVTALHLLSLALDICEKSIDDKANKTSAGGQSYLATPHLSEDATPFLIFAIEASEVGTNKEFSLISLLVSLMRKHDKENNDAESRLCNINALIEGLLKKFAQLSADCMNTLKHLAPHVVFQMPEYSSHGAKQEPQSHPDTAKRKAMARARQAAVLEKMRIEQSKFSASCKSMEEDDIESMRSDPEQLQEDSPCCSLCRDTCSKSPLSFLVLLQKSRVLSIVDRGPPSWKDKTEKDIDHTPSHTEEVGVSGSQNHLVSFYSASSSSRVPPLLAKFNTTMIGSSRIPQPPSCHGVRTSTLPPIEIMEEDMYLLITKDISHVLSHSNLTGVPEDKQRVIYDGDKDYVAGLLSEASKFHLSYMDRSEHLHMKKANPVSTVPRLSDCDGIHISSCGHAVHQDCYDRYLSSLRQRFMRRLGFEGVIPVNPDMGELLCPVCRRFANSILPVSYGGVSSKLCTQRLMSNGASMSDGESLTFPGSDNSVLLIPFALSIFWSASTMVTQGRYSVENLLKLLPGAGKQNESIGSALQPILRKLHLMYHPHDHASIVPLKPYHSLMLWDTLRYSLIASEVASRGRESNGSEGPCSSLGALYAELDSSSGRIASKLLQAACTTKSTNSFALLLRFRGVQLFANTVRADILARWDRSNVAWTKEPYPSILGHVGKEDQVSISQFLKFAADPVLTHDPFSSLMWVLFALPHPFMLCNKSFQSLVHLFYIVSAIQALIACKKTPYFDTPNINNGFVYDICTAMGKFDPAAQYFVSNHIDGSCDLKDMIRKLTFPYLRRCALFLKFLKQSASGLFPDNSNVNDSMNSATYAHNLPQDLRDVAELENMFQICSLEVIFSDRVVQVLCLKWCQHFLEVYKIHEPGSVLYSTPAVPFTLMKLPVLYQDLLQRYIKEQCHVCGNVPEDPALCLLCGQVCSPSWKLCCRENECRTHANRCGAGIGIFLLVRITTILLHRSSRRSVWPSPYLDAFGEEDHKMSRGRPLYLSEERYLNLEKLVASHGLDHSSEVLNLTNIFHYDLD